MTQASKPLTGQANGRTPPVVGIWCSTNGLEVLERFFSHLDAGSGMASVVIQHPSPPRTGALRDLLSQSTRMPVIEVQDGMTLQPDCVYVIQPPSDFTLRRGVIHLLNSTTPDPSRPPIDFFVRTVADGGQGQAVDAMLAGLPVDASVPLAGALREYAEQRLAQQPTQSPVSESAALRAMHELQVHKIELQMQNEALRESEGQAQDALARLAELNASIEGRIVTRTAELVAAREGADAANRAKSSFLSNISHELRTPLNGVLGMIELALPYATDARQIDWLQKARGSAKHLLSVINNVLDFSKLDAARMTLQPADLQLGRVLQLLTNLLAPQVTEKGLGLHVEIAPELADRSVQGDAQRLVQVLLNLVGNAVKFTDTGSVHVHVRVMEESPSQALVRFDVKDTGPGISSAALARLFNAFEQADASMARSHGGTGLGLVISKRMVELMGGEIVVESEIGVGSTFGFTAWLGTAAPGMQLLQPLAVTDAAAQLAAEFAGLRVLLAEDNLVNQEIMRALIENIGMQIDVADDGAVAVMKAQTADYALILMDLQMPKLGGIDATRAIRSIPGRQRTPIIALTASVFDDDRVRCIEAGMDDHVAKPVDQAVFYDTLLKWLRTR